MLDRTSIKIRLVEHWKQWVHRHIR